MSLGIVLNRLKHIFCSIMSTTSSTNNWQPLIVIWGCTGTGKSELGIEIAKQFNGEIINADSMQIYKGLDIVTNKLTRDEMQGIQHHLMNFYDPCKSGYHVHHYRDAVLPILQKIWHDKKLPIIVGGTGYYVEAAIYDNNLIPTTMDDAERTKQELLDKFPTGDNLFEELQRVDPESAAIIHKNATGRILRALTVFYSTGKTRSDHHKRQHGTRSQYLHFGSQLRFRKTLLITLDADHDVLEARLNKRVHEMQKRGLVEEITAFYDEVVLTAFKNHESLNSFGLMQSIGLKELLPYLKLTLNERNSEVGRKTLEKCIELIKLHTRQYAKVQRKWFYNRILLRAKNREVPDSIILNTTANFHECVVPFAIEVVDHFLSGLTSGSIVPTNPSVLMPLPPPKEQFDKPDYMSSKRLKYCDICKIGTEVGNWNQHLQGKKHRNALSSMNKIKKFC